MSNLLKMHLATQNQQLRARVHAAVIQTARQQANAGGASSAFSALVLSDLGRHWDEFILEVASTEEVQDAIAISDDSSFILARNVTDERITQIVNGAWGGAANKLAPGGES